MAKVSYKKIDIKEISTKNPYFLKDKKYEISGLFVTSKYIQAPDSRFNALSIKVKDDNNNELKALIFRPNDQDINTISKIAPGTKVILKGLFFIHNEQAIFRF